MSSLFETILGLSISTIFVALVVIILRQVLTEVPKKYSYMLWAVVFVRLLLPISFESVLSFVPPQVVEMSESAASRSHAFVQQEPQFVQPSSENMPISPQRPISNTMNIESTTLSENQHPEPIQPIDIVSIIWLSGMIIMIGYFIISYLKTWQKLRTAVFLRDNIYTSDRIASPFVFGFVKPKIYLPLAISESAADSAYIIAHEKTHIRRLDFLLKPLAFLALSIHWFNPMIWVCYYLMIKDMEMSCDESVIKHSGADIRTEYSTTLLQMSVKHSGLVSPTAFGESNTASRIKNVIRYRKPAIWITLASVIIVIIAVLGLVANPISANDKTTPLENLDEIKAVTEIERYVTEWLSDTSGIITLPTPSYERHEARGFYGTWGAANSDEQLYFQEDPQCDLEYMFTGDVYVLSEYMSEYEFMVYDITAIYDNINSDLYVMAYDENSNKTMFRFKLTKTERGMQFSLDKENFTLFSQLEENNGGLEGYIGVMSREQYKREYGITEDDLLDISYTDENGTVWTHDKTATIEQGEREYDDNGYPAAFSFYTYLVDGNGNRIYIRNKFTLKGDTWEQSITNADQTLQTTRDKYHINTMVEMGFLEQTNERVYKATDDFFNSFKLLRSVEAIDLFKQYFYGTYEDFTFQGSLHTFDDEVGNTLQYVSNASIFERDNLVFMTYTAGGAGQLYWLDKTDPDVVYWIMDYAGTVHIAVDQYYGIYTTRRISPPREKTDPDYLSIMDIKLLACELEPYDDKFFDLYLAIESVRYTDENGVEWVSARDMTYDSAPIYLTDRDPYTFSSMLLINDLQNESDERLQVVYTVTKQNGQWVQTIVSPTASPAVSDEEYTALLHDAHLDDLSLVPMADSNEYSILTVGTLEYNPVLFRKHFFGEWEDSEGARYPISDHSSTLANTGYIVWLTDDIIGSYYIGGGTYSLVYVDTNDPNAMYAIGSEGFRANGDDYLDMIIFINKERPTAIQKYNKVAELPSQGGSMATQVVGRIVLTELAHKYGITHTSKDFEAETEWRNNAMMVDYFAEQGRYLFLEVEYIDENGWRWFIHNPYFQAPIILERESETEIFLTTNLFLESTEETRNIAENRQTARYRVYLDGDTWKNEVVAVGTPRELEKNNDVYEMVF